MEANLAAAGAYLRRLRTEKGLSLTEVAAHFKTGEGQIRSIEKGRLDTRWSMMVYLCDYLDGSIDDLAALMLSEQATAEHGVRLAERWLQGQQGGKREILRVAEAPGEYVVNGKA
jgi:transcriptional regulator with XRE-family HTH domain